MNRTMKGKSSYYTVMNPVFETGNQLLIEQAKKEYRRQYKAAWKRAKRKMMKEVTLSLTEQEYIEIREEPTRHHKKMAPFIKEACISYLRKIYLVPDDASIQKLLQILKMTYIAIENLAEDENQRDFCKIVLSQMDTWEKDIRTCLINPLSFEQHLKKWIEMDSKRGQYLRTIIDTP